MARIAETRSLSNHIAEMSRVARDLRGVPDDVVAEAARSTAVTFAQVCDRPYRLAARRESYFWKVVRRRLLSRRAPAGASARFVVDAVVADLMEAGRDAEFVWSELKRGWADKVSEDILEEYRARLCA